MQRTAQTPEFKHAVLVEAMQTGFWLILDELNLAPTDVLEDNRELWAEPRHNCQEVWILLRQQTTRRILEDFTHNSRS